ncbi:MAG: glycosyltransferase family 39 protein [Candidatus Obscuribacterales bacterium]|nr:glycosyltransferase family 39 protein [Candidatus Obscuribacterales bacterium]
MPAVLQKRVETKAHTKVSSFPGDDRTAYLILMAVCLFLYFFGLDNCPIIDPSEGYYVEASREMLQLGDYVTPHLNYQIYFSKPILNFWLIAGSYNLFGLSELSARLPFAILSTLLVAATYWFGKALVNRRAGFIAGLSLATAPLLMLVSRKSSIDIAFTFFVNLSLFATALVLSRPTKWMWTLIYLALGLGFLTKGPDALVLYTLGLIAFLMAARPSFKILKQWFFALKPLAGVALFLAIVLPWHIAVSQATDGLFIKVFFWYEYLARFQSMANLSHVKYWFFLGVLGYGFFPWILFLPRALASALLPARFDYSGNEQREPLNKERGLVGKTIDLINSISKTILEDPRGRPLILLAIWSFTTFAVCSMSSTQLASYILPIVAPLAIVIGALLDRWLSVGLYTFTQDDRTYIKTASTLVAIVGAVGAIATVIYVTRIENPPWAVATSFYAIAAILAIGFTKQMLELFNGRLAASARWLVCSVVLVAAIGCPLAFHLAVTEIQGGLKELAIHADKTSDKIAMFGTFMPSYMFYARKPVDTFFHGHQLVPVKEPPANAIKGAYPYVDQSILVKDADLPNLKATIPCSIVEIEKRGEWGWYRTPGYEIESHRTLEDTFHDPTALNTIITGEAQTAPSTVPYAVGSLYRQYRSKSE